jgi:basic membrane protein A and related proteins
VAEGRFKGGIQEFGLAENGVGYVFDDHNRGWIPSEVHAQVEGLRRAIVAGEIKVPHE